MKAFILATVLICTATAEGLAQQGEVKGRLSTPAGTPVEGYPVIISGAGQSGRANRLDILHQLDGRVPSRAIAPWSIYRGSGQRAGGSHLLRDQGGQ